MPLKTGRWAGRNLARLGAALRPLDCRRAEANLALAFPEKDDISRHKIFRDSIIALGENFYDTLATPGLLNRDQFIGEEMVQGTAALADELQELARGGQGVLILTGHLGCWELLGGWLSRCVAQAGLGQLAVVTGSIHNAPVDRLIQQRRQDLGMKVLPREKGAAPLLRHLQAGGVAAVLLDQNTRVENLPIPFFGQDAPTPMGFARIALRYGIPILPVVLAKRGTGHQVRRSEARVCPERQQDHDEALRELLLWCNQKLESFIRRNPTEWVWFHQRWSRSAKTPTAEDIKGS